MKDVAVDRRLRPGTVAGAVVALVYRCVGAIVSAGFALRLLLPAGQSTRLMCHERLGRWPGFDPGPARAQRWLWLHAASVGEVAASAGLIAALRERAPDLRVLLTAGTAAGRAAAAALPVDEIRYLPLDYTPIIKRILHCWRPHAFVAVETEIWPALLGGLQAAGVATGIVSARISDRSWPRYRRIAALLEPVLAGLALVAARDEVSRGRYVALGVRPDRALVVGDLKLDAVSPVQLEAAPDRLREVWKGPDAGCSTIVAVSTHPGESEVLLDAYDRVRARHAQLHLALAPRHPERAEPLYRELARRRIRFVRWSQIDGAVDGPQVGVLVIDTLGQAREFLKSALGAFVGGTLEAVGGHNPLEPAAFGLPLVCGPHVDKIRSQVEGLVACRALRIVHDAETLSEVWSDWLDEPQAAREAGVRARAFVVAGSGVATATAEKLAPLLETAAFSPERHP